MFTYIVFCLLLSATATASADSVTYVLDKDQIKYINDGDTFTIHCIPGLRCENNKLGIRPPNVDTPEIKGDCESERLLARLAKQHTVQLLREADVIVLKPISRQYDRYGRLLAHVIIDGQDLGESLIEHNLGKPYTNRRVNWCK